MLSMIRLVRRNEKLASVLLSDRPTYIKPTFYSSPVVLEVYICFNLRLLVAWYRVIK